MNRVAVVPGIMISQVWPRACYARGATAEAVSQALDTGAFRAVQTVHVTDRRERHRLNRLLSGYGRPLFTYCLARRMGEARLNLSSPDSALRLESVENALRGLDEAREVGAARVSMVSGPTPADPNRRPDALEALTQSLATIAEHACRQPPMLPVIEPLDVRAHKKGTLGTLAEARAICRELRGRGLAVAICADTSHMILNGEDSIEETLQAGAFLAEFHLCNPVVVEDHWLFGDRHIRFGEPGVLEEADLPVMVKRVIAGLGQEDPRTLGVFLEVLNPQPDDPEAAAELLQYNVDVLERALSPLSPGMIGGPE